MTVTFFIQKAKELRALPVSRTKSPQEPGHSPTCRLGHVSFPSRTCPGWSHLCSSGTHWPFSLCSQLQTPRVGSPGGRPVYSGGSGFLFPFALPPVPVPLRSLCSPTGELTMCSTTRGHLSPLHRKALEAAHLSSLEDPHPTLHGRHNSLLQSLS